jgi:Secretion system C-terminal sorting domain
MYRYLFILFVVVLPGSSFAQLPNLGMELWRTSSSGDSTPVTIQAPVSWYGSDSLIIALGQSPLASLALGSHDTDWHRQIFRESTIRHYGAYSAKIVTVRQDSFLIPGILTNANPGVSLTILPPYVTNVTYVGGTGVTTKPTSVSAWVRYFPGRDSTGHIGADSGRFTVQSLASIGGIDSVIGTADIRILPDTGWVQVTANIVYTDTIYPVDTIQVAFASSSGSTGLNGSTLYIDDISSRDEPNPPQPVDHTNVKRLTAGDKIYVYPNPATGKLYIESTLGKELTCRLFSVSGLQVFAEDLAPHQNAIDVSQLPGGMYFYEISSASGILQRGKVVVTR